MIEEESSGGKHLLEDDDDEEDDDDDDGFSVTMWWFVVLGCLVFVFMQIYYLIKINYVPELYLIDDFIWCQSCK